MNYRSKAERLAAVTKQLKWACVALPFAVLVTAAVYEYRLWNNDVEWIGSYEAQEQAYQRLALEADQLGQWRQRHTDAVATIEGLLAVLEDMHWFREDHAFDDVNAVVGKAAEIVQQNAEALTKHDLATTVVRLPE